MTQRLTPADAAETTASPLGDHAIILSLIASETGHEAAQTLNYLRFLVQKLQGSQQAPELAGFALPEIERLERLVQHLRQFKLPPLVLTEVALAALFEHILSTLNDARATAGVTWTIEAQSCQYVHTDASYLTTALRCLATHALANAPPGSVIRVRAARIDGVFEKEILVEITDAGAPLPDTSPRALFDVWTLHAPDSQAARRAIAHRLLRYLGSTLTYEYTGGSSVFRCSLPAAPGAT